MPEDKVIEAIKKEIEDLLSAKRSSTGVGLVEDISPGVAGTPGDGLEWLLEELAAQARIDINSVPVRSTRPVWGPLITLIKRAVRKSTYWLYQPLFEQVSLFNQTLVGIITEIAHAKGMVPDQAIPRISDKINVPNVINELSVTKQYCADLLRELGELRRRVDSYRSEAALLTTKLKLALNHQTTSPALTTSQAENTKTQLAEITSQHQAWIYHAFEQQFRGPEELIKERQRAYIPDVRKAYETCGGYVLDLGAGRGEFLELCREAGIPARGVDLNEAMISRCREKGLEVEKADGLAYLRDLPDESLCALTAFQVVEHLDPDTLLQLIQTSATKLKPGAVIILETVNPDSLIALKDFYVDLTHQRPIPSATLRFLLEVLGFRHVEVRFTSPVPEDFRLKETNTNFQKLNQLLFTYRDYAVLGWR